MLWHPPQGRAEEVLFALTWDLKPSTKLLAGYRILEGGADNDEVYTFSLLHHAVAGSSCVSNEGAVTREARR